MQYNPGNYEKYMTKNPLKRKMVERLNKKIVGYVQQILRTDRGKKIKTKWLKFWMPDAERVL